MICDRVKCGTLDHGKPPRKRARQPKHFCARPFDAREALDEILTSRRRHRQLPWTQNRNRKPDVVAIQKQDPITIQSAQVDLMYVDGMQRIVGDYDEGNERFPM